MDNRLPKKEYFMKRLNESLENGHVEKARYYMKRCTSEIEKEKNEKLKKELKDKEYLFNFKEGGWHRVLAKTKRGAMKKMREEYKDEKDMTPDYDSVRLKTEEEYENLMMLFY